MKLMIVDDEPLEREVLLMMIKKQNLRVTHFFEAQNGLDALKLAKDEQMDLVIMDIKMPVMDGLTAAEMMKRELPNCRVIFLTAYDEFDFAYRTIKLGADDYLLKPAHPEDIKQTLTKFIPIENQNPLSSLSGHCKSQEIQTIMDYIGANLGKELNLERLSRLVHRHPQYLSRLFKQETGHTITHFITIARLEKAKYYFDNTSDTVAEISEKCGIYDANYFSRLFKKHEGMTPTEYQQQALGVEKKKLSTFGKFVM